MWRFHHSVSDWLARWPEIRPWLPVFLSTPLVQVTTGGPPPRYAGQREAGGSAPEGYRRLPFRPWQLADPNYVLHVLLAKGTDWASQVQWIGRAFRGQIYWGSWTPSFRLSKILFCTKSALLVKRYVLKSTIRQHPNNRLNSAEEAAWTPPFPNLFCTKSARFDNIFLVHAIRQHPNNIRNSVVCTKKKKNNFEEEICGRNI